MRLWHVFAEYLRRRLFSYHKRRSNRTSENGLGQVMQQTHKYGATRS